MIDILFILALVIVLIFMLKMVIRQRDLKLWVLFMMFAMSTLFTSTLKPIWSHVALIVLMCSSALLLIYVGRKERKMEAVKIKYKE